MSIYVLTSEINGMQYSRHKSGITCIYHGPYTLGLGGLRGEGCSSSPIYKSSHLARSLAPLECDGSMIWLDIWGTNTAPTCGLWAQKCVSKCLNSLGQFWKDTFSVRF